MVWSQLDGTTWADAIDGAEKVFYDMSQAFRSVGKEHGSVYIICKINVPESFQEQMSTPERLRNAWKLLRTDFPSLGVVADAKQKRSVAATIDGIDKWAEETFDVNKTEISAHKIVSSLHLRQLPYLCYLPATSEVIFHCSHWRIDARGAAMLLNRLFERFYGKGNTLSEEENYGHLSPSLEDALSSPTFVTARMDQVAEAIRRRNFESPSVGLPVDTSLENLPTVFRPHSTRLTPTATTALVESCKTRGISITAAIHSACARAIFNRSRDSTNDYSGVVSVSLRHQLPAPFNTAAYACATYVTGITHTVERSASLLTSASRLTKAYRGDWDTAEYINALRPIYKTHGEALQANTQAKKPPTRNITISSLGIVDKYLNKEHVGLKIEKFHLGSAIMAPQMTLYIWTFDGRLTTSLDSNAGYYSSVVVQAILSDMSHILESELAIKLDFD